MAGVSTTATSTGGRANKYEIVRRIGLNGSSELFLGKGAGGTGEQVVIKRLSPAAAQREDEVARFTNEARVAMALRHPNIIPAIDFGQDDLGWYLVLSAVQGQALRRVMDALGKPFPLPQAFNVILEVSRALIHAHQVPDPRGAPGILHRGISPVTILMGVDGVTRLLDFGLERPAPRADDDPRRVRYLSPEQACGAPLDPRSDVYSLGAVLFELTTGRPLFTSTSTPELLRSIVDGEILAPTSVVSDYPLDLEELVVRSLSRDPAARFDHAGDLAAALEVFLLRNDLAASPEQMQAFLKPLLGAPKAAPVAGGVATVRAEASAALKLAQEKQAATRRELEAKKAQKVASEISARAGELELELGAPGDTVASFQMPEIDLPQPEGDPPLVVGDAAQESTIDIEVIAPAPKMGSFAPPPPSPETEPGRRRPTLNEPIQIPSDTEPGMIPPGPGDVRLQAQTSAQASEAARKIQEAAERIARLETERAELQSRVAELERAVAEEAARVASASGEASAAAAQIEAARQEGNAEREAQLRSEIEESKSALEAVKQQTETARQEALAQRKRADAAEAAVAAAKRELAAKSAGAEKQNEAKEAEFAARLQAEIAQVEAGALRLVDAAKRESELARKELEDMSAEAGRLRNELDETRSAAAEAKRQADEAIAAAEAAAREAQEARASAETASADAAAKGESESAATAKAQAALADAQRARAEAKASRREADQAKKAAEAAIQKMQAAEEAKAAAEAAVLAAEEKKREIEAADAENAAKRKAEVAAAMQVVRTAIEEANEARQEAEAAKAAAEEARISSEAAKADANVALDQANAARVEADRILAEAAEIRARAEASARAAAVTRREANQAKAEAEKAVREAEEKRAAALQVAEQIRESSEARETSAKRAEQASFEMVQAAGQSMEAAKQEAALARADAQRARDEAARARTEVEALQREARAAKALADAAILEAESTLEKIEAVRRDALLDSEIAALQTEEARWAAHAERMKALLADAPTGEELDGAFDGLLVGGGDSSLTFDSAVETEYPEPRDEGTLAETTHELVADESSDAPIPEDQPLDESSAPAEGPAVDEVVDDLAARVPQPRAGGVEEEAPPPDEGTIEEPVDEGAAIEEPPPMDTEPEAHVPNGASGAPGWTENTLFDAPPPATEAGAPVALAGRTNLGADDSPFVGRDALLADLDERMRAGERLFVLYGPPGSGRTRVARQLGVRHLLDLSKEGGVWYVPMQHARIAADVCREIGRALSLKLSYEPAAADAQISASLSARKRILLILDDVDGAASALPALVGGWLAAAEQATFVVVAESADVLPDAATIPIGPLPSQGANSEGSRQVQNVHDRVHPGKALEAGGAAAVASLLAGNPLAVGLAVGSGLAPKEMGKELAGKLKSASDGDVLQRVLEWRWSRLNGWEKLCFAHASVFEGSFATDAAAAVIDLSAHQKAPPMEEILESLRVGGLIRAAGAGRWDFHPTVGTFASTKLPASPRAKVAARRDAFMAALAGELAPFAEARSAEALQRLSDERVQLIACLKRSIGDRPSAPDALALLRALGPLLSHEGLASDLAPWTDATLAAAEAANIRDASVASLLRLRAGFRRARGEAKEAAADLDAAEKIALQVRDPAVLAQIRIDAGRVLAADPQRRKAARAKLDEALAAAESTEDVRLQACVLAEIGALGRFAGLDAVARDAYERALACAEKAGDRALECEVRTMFGVLLAESGNRAAARGHLGTAVSFATELGDRATAARAAHVLGLLALEEGFAEPAEERFRVAIETFAEIGERREEAIAWGDLAIALELQGRADDAQRSRAWAMSVLGEVEDRPSESVQMAYMATAEAVAGNGKASKEAFATAKRNAAKGTLEGDVVDLLFVCSEVAIAKAMNDNDALRQKKAAAALKIAARNPNEPLALRIARRIASRALEGEK